MSLAALAAAAAAAVLLAGCPLPFDFSARGAGAAQTVDPSSPRVTASVTVSYQDSSGASGTVADGTSYASGLTTTVTLSTPTPNATIYYTDDGASILDVNKVKRISGSSGSFTITRASTTVSTTFHAVAIGPSMVPSPPVQATVSVTPYPVITIVRNAASISENGGTAIFTVQSNVAPAAPLTINLLAGGSHQPYDFTGTIPSSVALPAGQTTVTAATITAVPDVENTDDTVTVTVLADSATPQAYVVGAPSSASVLIKDNGLPGLTLSTDRSFMNNSQTATFTVTASTPMPAAATVPISASGFTPGLVNVPSSVTVAKGATSAQFQVTAASQSSYPTQTPQVSLGAGSTYVLGSPAKVDMLITDSAYVLSGVWDFTQGLSSGVSGASAWSISGNVSLAGGSLSFPGDYSTDVASNNVAGIINQDLFTIGVGFRVSSLPGPGEIYGRAIVAAGGGSRWFIIRVDDTGEIWVDLNNHAAQIDTGFNITAGTDHSILVSVARANLGMVAIVDGVRHDLSTLLLQAFPNGFAWNSTSSSEMVFYNSDYSSGGTMAGLWHWMYLAAGVL